MYTKDLKNRKLKLESDIGNYVKKAIETFDRDTGITVKDVDVLLNTVDVTGSAGRDTVVQTVSVTSELAL